MAEKQIVRVLAGRDSIACGAAFFVAPLPDLRASRDADAAVIAGAAARARDESLRQGLAVLVHGRVVLSVFRDGAPVLTESGDVQTRRLLSPATAHDTNPGCDDCGTEDATGSDSLCDGCREHPRTPRVR